MQNKRKNKRLQIHLNAEIKLSDGSIWKGKTENISFGGICISLNETCSIQVGDECDLIVILMEGDDRQVIKFKAKAIHTHEPKIGFQFLHIDIDSYDHFRNLMLSNSKDPDKLQEELEQNPGIFV